MQDKKRQNKKDLKGRLSYVMMIYMDGLNNRKKERLHKYLEGKLTAIVNYYVGLLKKKERRNLILPELPQEAISLEMTKFIAQKLTKNEVGETQPGDIRQINF
jgi:hypothetical protein